MPYDLRATSGFRGRVLDAGTCYTFNAVNVDCPGTVIARVFVGGPRFMITVPGSFSVTPQFQSLFTVAFYLLDDEDSAEFTSGDTCQVRASLEDDTECLPPLMGIE